MFLGLGLLQVYSGGGVVGRWSGVKLLLLSVVVVVVVVVAAFLYVCMYACMYVCMYAICLCVCTQVVDRCTNCKPKHALNPETPNP